MREYLVIGVANHTDTCCSAEAITLLPQYPVFSGGERHYALVKHLLPAAHTWITIRGNMPDLFAQYALVEGPLVIFASGDPLFYGMVQTIYKYDPAAHVKVYPQFNSIQRLCAKTGQPYEKVRNTSVHGRSWQELDTALKGEPLISILTDNTRSPQTIAQWLLEYGFNHYEMWVGEDLDGAAESIFRLSLTEAATREFHTLNCVLMKQISRPAQPGLGIDDHLFAGLPGRPNMITKKAVRLLAISRLQLHQAKACWDIGFCTGAVAIEIKRCYPQTDVWAFEKRPECEDILRQNTRQLSAPGIHCIMGDFYEQEHASFPAPDAVFIGGHGNRLPELMQIIHTCMRAGGIIVMNAVLESSAEQFITMAAQLGWELQPEEVLQINEHNPIRVLTAIRKA
ncbi:precorrin-6y C5,15-methyltransferase (decarboxylating) subunit CbiE [Chitinophaga sp. Mgbs1]|uniref:Precorrin-6y C5,15-methyltransferase (Decarboxylating) subunit CbiE n=1 Tax=Chitinophaga solisilvae TaxID=1233460 RepID=A0A433WIU3_9BACT|nr:precorrin-6y C5,15-methyltransferase (decarboxylating) subunit CbiE [Chitinophaga solisilvae]